MPDVNWESRDASEMFIEDALQWLERYDLDGFRVDAVKHVVDGAIFNLGTRVRERFQTAGNEFFLMGETAMGWDPNAGPKEGGNVENYTTISRYISPAGLSGQFDFVLYYAAALQFVSDTPGRGMLHVDYWTQASQAEFPPDAVMTPYIASHDSPRFISLVTNPTEAWSKWENLPPAPTSSEPYDRMYAAFAWLFALPGAPLLYYGDEYGEYGGSDPDNRHVFRTSEARTERERHQFERVSRLTRARAELRALRSNTYVPLFVTESIWAVARGEEAERVLVILNRSPNAETVTIPIPRDIAGEGRAFVDALGGTGATIARAAITIELAPWSAKYLF
jgi:glycosidase